ncbi:hypothetical protein DFJ58DRAFT_656777 [Suillus subalutaceus]|uniref:uncharacterized protein n=1 Tax=Suillus subalutaceus TaxID=48586 RepID=UPI001B86BF19|nr:uncharacterized protein DFJ58DRAFT_656777 [Suillus subalutaceus]KAG1862581.1 hypothetical protein DFJ58DRAFT_656777 [Suillus subalutaceus]
MDKRRLGLGEYKLSGEEWLMVTQLRDVLKILKHATLYFSRAMPNLSMVIPAMDHIDTTFTNGMINRDLLHPAIHIALGLAKKTLNRYYSLTDASEVYWITMGKRQQHKLEYFKCAGWKPEWIETAKDIVCE